MESLEHRRHLAGNAFASVTGAGTLLVTGTSQNNVVSIEYDASSDQVLVTLDGVEAGFPAGQVRRARVDLGDGDDLMAPIPFKLRSTILGGAGNDTLQGGRIDDSLDGGAGDDVLKYSEGDDTVRGGDGIDRADYWDAPSAIWFIGHEICSENGPIVGPFGIRTGTVAIGGTGNNCGERSSVKTDLHFVDGETTEQISGTRGDDEFRSTSTVTFPNGVSLFGRAGDDTFFNGPVEGGSFFGEAGDDVFIIAEDGNLNPCYGGAGNDLVVGGVSGRTFFDGGAGQDTLQLGRNVQFDGDTITLDVNGPEVVLGIYPGNKIVGNDKPNRFVMESDTSFTRPATILGGGGNDTIIGGDSSDLLVGGDGDDSIDGGGGNDTLRGNGGNDTLVGGGGIDQLFGGDGDDTFFARDGRRDTIRGGAGADRATADTVGGVIDLISEVEEVS